MATALAALMVLAAPLAGCLRARTEHASTAEPPLAPGWVSALYRGGEVRARVAEGHGILEEDILIGTEEELGAHGPDLFLFPSSEREASIALRDSSGLWPGNRIPYEIDGRIADSGPLVQAIARWNASATVVPLIPRTGEKNFLRFERAYSAGVCASYVGLARAAGQPLLVGAQCSSGNLLHEIGHAAGLFHEHTRGDRDSFLRVHWENIFPGLESNFWKRTYEGRDLGAYDFASIMHYGPLEFSANGRAILDPLPVGVSIGQRSGLSPGDLAGLAQLYAGGGGPPGTGGAPSPSLLSDGRYLHTATLLANGKVLVSGGLSTGLQGAVALASAEIFDPGTRHWSLTGPMAIPRAMHTASLLPDGRVLVVGGFDGGDYQATAEFYDPASGSWSPAPGLAAPLAAQTANSLANGSVLLCGGLQSIQVKGQAGKFLLSLLADSNIEYVVTAPYCQSYDPVSNCWSQRARLPHRRYAHLGVALPSGQILFAGGSNGMGEWNWVLPTDIYDPARDSFAVGPDLRMGRTFAEATVMPDGGVFFAGGKVDTWTFLPATEAFSPDLDSGRALGILAKPRGHGMSFSLPGGRFLLTGGVGPDVAPASGAPPQAVLDSTEIFDFAKRAWSAGPPLPEPRAYASVTALPAGFFLIAGGAGLLSSVGNGWLLYDGANGSWIKP